MVRKSYSEEFKQQAVDLYESSPGATVRGIAADLGVERGTLRHWLEQLGTGRKTAADGAAAASPLRQRTGSSVVAADESPAQRMARLERRVVELEAEQAKLVTEREILRQAAKYFAGETNW